MARAGKSASKGKFTDKLLIGVLGLGCVALAFYAFVFTDRLAVIKVSKEELQKQVDAHLPIENSVLGMNFGIKRATVELDAAQGRVVVAFSPTLGAINLSKEIGTMTLSGRIHYLQETGEFYFIMPRTEKIDLVGVPGTAAAIGEITVGALANEYLSRFPVYTLQEDDDRQKLLKSELRYIRIHEDSIEIAFRKPF